MTMVAERVPDEPFVAWAKREWLLVAITTGIALDWLPWVATPFVPQVGALSGTRILVLPGLALACLLRPNWILRPHQLGVLYLATILATGGLGWAAGTVATSRLVTIVVNGFILIYYLQIRSLVSIRRVLAIVFVFSILVPVVQFAARIGIISVPMLESLGVDLRLSGTRIFSIFDSTTVGLVPLMIPACLGGLIFLSAPRRSTLHGILAAGLVTFGITSALVAQQRSGGFAYAASTVVAIAFYAALQRRQLLRIVLVFSLVSGGVAYFTRDFVLPAQQRFSDVEAYEGASALRLGGVVTFISDLLQNPLRPVPIGHQSLLDRTGVEPHLLISEAYYEGGALFLTAIVIILVKFAVASIALAKSPDPQARLVGSILCAFGAGALIQVTLQTALGLRMVPLMLGVGIAGRRILRLQARPA
jgi:hypothetical protein